MADDAEKLARMEELFHATINTKVSDQAIEWLATAHLLMRITGDDLDAAKGAISTLPGRKAAAREYDGLEKADRIELLQEVSDYWAIVASVAVRQLWHACEVLGIDPDSLDAEHVGIVAATHLGSKVAEVGTPDG